MLTMISCLLVPVVLEYLFFTLKLCPTLNFGVTTDTTAQDRRLDSEADTHMVIITVHCTNNFAVLVNVFLKGRNRKG